LLENAFALQEIRQSLSYVYLSLAILIVKLTFATILKAFKSARLCRREGVVRINFVDIAALLQN
jgi:hypothetical protein